MIPPFSPGRSTYCRLFPPSEKAWSEEALRALGMSMKPRDDGETAIPFECRTGEPIGAAYTYFGQFIDHDLTEDRTALRNAGEQEPDCTVNHRSHFLDLEHLYGNGPLARASQNLYAKDGVSFALGEVLTEGQPFDVPLVGNEPQIADHRNNENVLVRQVHAMFLKLHNLIAAQLPRELDAPKRFITARAYVRWQYQWLVRHDFLARIC